MCQDSHCGILYHRQSQGKPAYVEEYCIRHGYGAFLDTLEGLVCFECYKRDADDYDPCASCGMDHYFEADRAEMWHNPMLPGMCE